MRQSIVIIDAGGANFASIEAALNRLDIEPIITSNPDIIISANKIILPGVGAARYAMDLIHKKELYDVIRSLKQPVLGICLGQQLLCEFSSEGDVDCLGVIPIRVKRLPITVIIPHMGWNNLNYIKLDEPLFKDITTKDNFYFVHSFAPEINEDYTIAKCNYDIEFSAVIKKNNFYGVQFHPEKSGIAGEKFLKNFFSIWN